MIMKLSKEMRVREKSVGRNIEQPVSASERKTERYLWMGGAFVLLEITPRH